MADVNLRQRFAVIMHNPTDEQCKKVIRNLRVKWTAATPHWNYVEAVEGIYEFGFFDDALKNILTYTPEAPISQLFQAPAWVDTSLHPRGEPAHPWVPYLPPDKVPKWEAFVEAFCYRYKGKIKFINLDTETNIEGIWKGTPEEYAYNVIIPAAKIIKKYGMSVVAPGITIQRFESDAHYQRAKDHMIRIMTIAGPFIDKVSMHSYAKSSWRTLDQIKSFVRDCGLTGRKLWVTEFGFPEDWYWVKEDAGRSILERFLTGQERQLRRFEDFMPDIDHIAMIEKWCCYRGFDTEPREAEKHGTNGLLNWRLNQKKAAKYIKEIMMDEKQEHNK